MRDEELFETTVVAWLNIRMSRNGMMRFEGTITDHASIIAMLDTARASVMNSMKTSKDGKIIVPGYDTALVGTDHEKKLLKATEDLHKAAH